MIGLIYFLFLCMTVANFIVSLLVFRILCKMKGVAKAAASYGR